MDCFVEMLQDKNEEVRIEAIIGLSYRKDKRVLSVLCDELKKILFMMISLKLRVN